MLGLANRAGLMARIQHQLAEVVLETSFVGVKGLLASILAAVVDRNTNRSGKLHTQTDSFDLVEGEASAETKTVLVTSILSANSGSEFIERARGSGSGSSSAGLESSLLATGLVEPGSDVALPVLAQMNVGDDVVMLNHWPKTL